MSSSRWKQIIILVAIAVFPLPAFAEPTIVPLNKVFRVEEPTYSKDGVLRVPGSSKSYDGSVVRKEFRFPGEKYLVLSTGDNQSYLLDGPCLDYDENVVDLGDGRVVMACQSGGVHCCSTFVCLLKDDKAAGLKIGGSKTIDFPDLGVSKESIRHIDHQGNMSIEVTAFSDRYYDVIDDSTDSPSFTYYIKVLKNGNIIVDRDVKSYEAAIKELKAALSKSYDFETYARLVFYNRVLNLKLSEGAYLTKASAAEKGVAMRGIKWLFEDIPFVRLIDHDGFTLKHIVPK